MPFLNDERSKWKKINQGNAVLFYKGSEEFAISVLTNSQENNTQENLTALLNSINDFSSGVIETDKYIIAWVDHVRSWPLFFTQTNDTLIISNNARLIQKKENLQNTDASSCLEFAMSGYVSGPNTILKDLNCLQPGEFLIWDKTNKKLNLTRYHQYIPDLAYNKLKRQENIQILGSILDELTKKIINKANDRPIWIPLSGGLDSRIILCKLHEHGYKNLHTFTYGPRFNFESKIASKVAKKLGVSWRFIHIPKKTIRQHFLNKERKEYWDFADGLKVIPGMREFSALTYLHENNLISDDAIFINGQSGDYITGNHISNIWMDNKNFTPDSLLEILFSKHYDLWKPLKTHENLQIIKSRVENLLPQNWKSKSSGVDMATLEEIWEYDARQVCLVINDQRVYDYYGHDWEMPLWEKQLVDFCETLPIDQKIGQNLYKEYLRQYNYMDLFPEKEPHIWRWPLFMLWVVPIARIIGITLGKNAKTNFYALMRYHGHYANQFHSFPWDLHKKTYKDTRNVTSLHVHHWIKENSALFCRSIADKIGI